jgi:lipopolysaccharide transport system ATP-binding protein
MNDLAIRVENLSKHYKIGALAQRHDTLRDHLVHTLQSLFSEDDQGRGVAAESAAPSEHRVSLNGHPASIWAVKDISFEVGRGEVVGVIGRNGAGKSTLLKILSRITEPTEGRAEIYGRIGSLLEVGTGFHPELTGRENIFLNGAILGMAKTEIQKKFDEIVDFAEIEKFIDTPVKRYSSGMYVRLAFAVAAHLEPDILILDEVLAVGDSAFQNKCIGKMQEVAGEGRTVLFVSHNMAAMARLCKSAILLDKGQLQAYGPTEEIVSRYLATGAHHQGEVRFSEDAGQEPGSEAIRLIAVRVKNSKGEISSSLDCRLPFVVESEYRILRRVSNLRIGCRLVTCDGTVVFASKDVDSVEDLERVPGTYVSRCKIPGNFLNYGEYFVSVGSDTPSLKTHFFCDRILSLRIEQTGGVGGHISDNRSGLLRLALPWEIVRIDNVVARIWNRN